MKVETYQKITLYGCLLSIAFGLILCLVENSILNNGILGLGILFTINKLNTLK